MPKRTGLGQRGLELLISSPSDRLSDAGQEKEKKEEDSLGGRKASAAGKKKPSSSKNGTASSTARKTKKAAGTAASSKYTKSTSRKKRVTVEEAIPSEQELSAVDGNNVMVPVSKVEPNRTQPRRNFDEDALQELAESIQQYGIIQPLIVQKKEDYYEIIAGERRWRAARIAGLKEIPVIIREYTPREVMEISLIENIQREDLNPIEEADAYRRLMEEFSLKQDEVAQRLSKSRAAIANSVRLLNLDQRVQEMIVSQMISTGHARALLSITDPEQQYQTAQRVFDEKLTVRDVEKLVRKMNAEPATQVKRQISDALQAVYESLAEQMKSALGTKVSITPRSAQKGKIEIEYYSSDELDRLCTLLNNIASREES